MAMMADPRPPAAEPVQRACRNVDGSAKVHYAVRADARRRVRELRRSGDRADAYPCPLGNGHHVGHGWTWLAKDTDP